MVDSIDIYRTEKDRTRVELTLGRIAQSWKYLPRGPAFTQALLDLLSSITSKDTLRSYSFSILELWGWYEQRHRRLVTPDHITRADAAEYSKWLRDREQGLEGWWLKQDPAHDLDRMIFDIVQGSPGIGIDGIRQHLRSRHGMITIYQGQPILKIDHPDEGKSGGLGYHLGCMVRHRMLNRSPSVEELRREVNKVFRPDDQEFRYYPPVSASPAGASRSSTLATRLSALSSLWRYMMKGENAPGREEPLIKHDIWNEPLKGYQAQAHSHKAATRAAKTPTKELIMMLLESTYYRTHGRDLARVAARAAMWGGNAPAGEPSVVPSFRDLRDRLLILLMTQTGLRAREIGSLRRMDVSGSPPVLSVTGKRGKRRAMQLPPSVVRSLNELSTKLSSMVEHQRQNNTPARAADLLRDEAPLVPPLRYWGQNSGRKSTGISRPGLAKALQRRANMAGIEPGSDEMNRIHPHGMRHLFAHIAADSGTPMNRIQAMLGHASMATTSVYVEERAPEHLIAEAFRSEPEPSPSEPVIIEPRLAPPREEIAAEWEQEIEPPRLPAARRQKKVTVDAPEPALSGAPSREVIRVEEDEIERARDKPLSKSEQEKMRRCRGIKETPLRRLCEIYQLHWGEKGDRQRLVKPETASGPKAQEAQMVANSSHREAVARAAEIRGQREMDVQSEARMYSNVYSGKSSGLSWWTGSSGSLVPEMPLISPGQIGSCDENDQGELCGMLIGLWRRWYEQSPDKAAALTMWIADAFELTAQVEMVVIEREGCWVSSGAPWDMTRVIGRRRSPEPRKVFREHITGQVAAWFEAVAWQHRTSPGDPEGDRRGRSQKVMDDHPPGWYGVEDPIGELPPGERQDLIDWLLALTGKQPQSHDRKRVSAWINSLCTMDEVIDMMREDPRLGPAFVSKLLKENPSFSKLNSRGVGYIADLIAEHGDDDLEDYEQRMTASEVFRMISEAERTSLQSFRVAKGSYSEPLDTWGLVHERVVARNDPDGGRARLSTWYLSLVKKHLGAQVAKDPAIKMVVRCGRTPLSGDEMRNLFNVKSGNIEHTERFKRSFALRYGAHSECVARRIARGLWDMRTKNPSSQYVTEPRYMLVMIDSMMAFKVPCSDRQSRELRGILGTQEPIGIFGVWKRAKEEPGVAGEGAYCPIRAEIEEELSEMQEAYLPNSQGPALPNPIQLLAALV